MYMAPELSEGSQGRSHPSDIFSLGMIAYELFSGELPFARPPVWARWRGSEKPAPSLAGKRPDLAQALVEFVDRCLQLDPGRRPTAAEIVGSVRRSSRLTGGALDRHTRCRRVITYEVGLDDHPLIDRNGGPAVDGHGDPL